MIDKALLESTVERSLEGTDLFLVDIAISKANDIIVEIDSLSQGVDIEQCAELTRCIEAVFDRDAEDYSLEVGSAGITAPLKVRAQYIKNIGHDVEVLTGDGRKLRGTISAVADGGPLDRQVSFTLSTNVKVKDPGAKRPVVKAVEEILLSTECKYVRPELKF